MKRNGGFDHQKKVKISRREDNFEKARPRVRGMLPRKSGRDKTQQVSGVPLYTGRARTYHAEKEVQSSLHPPHCQPARCLACTRLLRVNIDSSGSRRVAFFSSVTEGRENAWARITGCHECTLSWIASTADDLENVFMHADAGVL
jgi:hypothetical protein